MGTLENLLVLYTGIVLVNAALSGIQWWIQRSSLHRSLTALWVGTFIALMAQGALRTGEGQILMGFAFVVLINGALAELMARVLGLRFEWKPMAAVFVVSLGLAAVLHTTGAGFAVAAIPVAFGGCFPLILVVTRVLQSIPLSSMSFSMRGLLVSSVFFVVHTADFPFLRMVEWFAPIGFTIAILIVFGLSVFAPAVVLEIVTEKQTRFQAEMSVAHRIQTKILPSNPKLSGLELAAYMKPADEVGGDYYDVYEIGDYSWILLGDVTGHGLSSGLVMLMAQSIITSILHTRADITPGELNHLANAILHENLQRLCDDRTMTIIALCRQGNSRQFRFSGMHDDIYVYRAATKHVDIVHVEQVPHGLGLLNEFDLKDFGEEMLNLGDGDLLLLSTDGITEAAAGGDYKKGMFEEGRVVEFLKAHASEPVARIKERLVEDLQTFTGGVYHDDVTFLLVRATA